MGLIVDPYDFSAGTPAVADQVDLRFSRLYNLVNGAIDGDNLLDATAQQLGLSDTGAVRQGKSIIATEQARTNTAYDTLTTPDRVQNVVLPTDGLLFVAYRARWWNSVASNGRAAVFLGNNQLKYASASSASAQVDEAVGPNNSSWALLESSSEEGLWTQTHSPDYTGDVTTGMLLGSNGDSGALVIWAAAGTYTVSIQFKSLSGSVTVVDRKLWVWTKGF